MMQTFIASEIRSRRSQFENFVGDSFSFKRALNFLPIVRAPVLPRFPLQQTMPASDLNVLLNEKQTLNEIVSIMRGADLDTLTPKNLKRQLENRLGLEDKILDQEPWKAKMKQLINDAQELHDQGSQSMEEDVTESVSKSATEKSAASSQAKPKKSKRKKANKSSPNVSDDSIDASSVASGDDDHYDDEHSAKKAKTSNNASDKSSSKATYGDSKAEETIKRLKNYVNKCGVRKVWSKELADCKTTSAQIARLKSILQDLGVEGRPTLEKCEKVKSERELKAEIESLSTENILETKIRNAGSAAPVDVEPEDNADEIEEAKKNDLDLSFLGDQSSDSE
ncbi:hypothetical protein INT43_000610 [Umbelopsis isabellina]|uniref:DEK-C domain-containing protein n=1 Tax=Mortierella isabellina TaxID=91625 RepID=A0A8H7Q2F1_MORIS|nr:hypothetical protein INT43_000610 [Umbelopsis isabellina]